MRHISWPRENKINIKKIMKKNETIKIYKMFKKQAVNHLLYLIKESGKPVLKWVAIQKQRPREVLFLLLV